MEIPFPEALIRTTHSFYIYKFFDGDVIDIIQWLKISFNPDLYILCDACQSISTTTSVSNTHQPIYCIRKAN